MSTITIPSALHVCPQCEQEVASGRNTINGEPRICTPCIAENVRNRAAMPYMKQSDEPEEQRETEEPPEQVDMIFQPSFIVWIFICGFLTGVSFLAGYMIGNLTQ